MNNPLEAVTQAVNSLVTALKLPDESAKANEVLGEMSFPQFSRLLPYRDYNQESGLFMNDTTMGFMLEAIPINGANESIVEALDHMLRTKLPRGIPLCIHLMSSQLVGDRIEYGLREFSWSGEQAERFNAIIDQSAERVRDQLSVMASPNGNHDRPVAGLAGQPEPLSAGYVPSGDGDGAVEPGDTQS
ncbi:TraC family protein [Escherichia coli]|uniref:TraC family protein n=1 Tax=Escherichia coli TaxID=562 RepID=UPI002477232C|nr:TraC family protein [Escherichia coli]MDT9115226.1 TraC family protein [Escherichia coli]MDV0662860.1 TraC family protein [Escherichia coli]MDV0750637.1 TraC family protein [Escherichia coli]MDV0777577.1 TraC family protein [Escherichia coli]MDV1112385.1 TraC family protein [Escherichia coli]